MSLVLCVIKWKMQTNHSEQWTTVFLRKGTCVFELWAKLAVLYGVYFVLERMAYSSHVGISKTFFLKQDYCFKEISRPHLLPVIKFELSSTNMKFGNLFSPVNLPPSWQLIFLMRFFGNINECDFRHIWWIVSTFESSV